jgi:hypothetical protein
MESFIDSYLLRYFDFILMERLAQVRIQEPPVSHIYLSYLRKHPDTIFPTESMQHHEVATIVGGCQLPSPAGRIEGGVSLGQ